MTGVVFRPLAADHPPYFGDVIQPPSYEEAIEVPATSLAKPPVLVSTRALEFEFDFSRPFHVEQLLTVTNADPQNRLAAFKFVANTPLVALSPVAGFLHPGQSLEVKVVLQRSSSGIDMNVDDVRPMLMMKSFVPSGAFSVTDLDRTDALSYWKTIVEGATEQSDPLYDQTVVGMRLRDTLSSRGHDVDEFAFTLVGVPVESRPSSLTFKVPFGVELRENRYFMLRNIDINHGEVAFQVKTDSPLLKVIPTSGYVGGGEAYSLKVVLQTDANRGIDRSIDYLFPELSIRAIRVAKGKRTDDPEAFWTNAPPVEPWEEILIDCMIKEVS